MPDAGNVQPQVRSGPTGHAERDQSRGAGGTSLGKSAPCPSRGTLKFQTASLKGPPGTQTQFLVFRLVFED